MTGVWGSMPLSGQTRRAAGNPQHGFAGLGAFRSREPAVWDEEDGCISPPCRMEPSWAMLAVIPAELCDRLRVYWGRLFHMDTILPEEISAASPEQVKAVRAAAVYSDGSAALKTVDWDTSAVDFSRPGVYEVKGTLRGNPYHFPLTQEPAIRSLCHGRGNITTFPPAIPQATLACMSAKPIAPRICSFPTPSST